MADGINNMIGFLIFKFSETKRPFPKSVWELKWCSGCFKGCYAVKYEYLFDSDIMLIANLYTTATVGNFLLTVVLYASWKLTMKH